jgi:hypothetical protein
MADTGTRAIVHARLDPGTRKLLGRLRRKTGLNDSELIRRALRVLGALEVEPGTGRVIGQGAFASGLSDLGSNRGHLEGFGR